MKEKNNNKKEQNQTTQIIASVLAIAILIVAVVGISFAVFTYTKQGERENTITTGSITMSYNEEKPGINITDAMPISDETGKNITSEDPKSGTVAAEGSGVFDFNVTASITGQTTIYYDITAKKEGDCTLKDNEVKLYLEKSSEETTGYEDDPVLQPTHFTTDSNTKKTINDTPDDEMLLHSDTFTSAKASDTHYYRLRMWVDENYGSDDVTGENFKTAKKFAIKVNVNGSATPKAG